MAGIECFIFLLVFGWYKPLLAILCNHEYAELTRVSVKWFYPLALVLLICGVLILIRLVSIILVLALLIIPTSILEKHASSLPQFIMDSTILCFAMCLIIIKIFYHGNMNASASIIGAVVATYLTKTLLELAKNWLSTKN